MVKKMYPFAFVQQKPSFLTIIDPYQAYYTLVFTILLLPEKSLLFMSVTYYGTALELF